MAGPLARGHAKLTAVSSDPASAVCTRSLASRRGTGGAPASPDQLRSRTARTRVSDPLRAQCHWPQLAGSWAGAAAPAQAQDQELPPRAVRAQWRLFQPRKLSGLADTTYLQDIPQYWPAMQRLGLVRFQCTVRELVSGLCFVGYADALSETYAVLLA